jgi:hypothetical protein
MSINGTTHKEFLATAQASLLSNTGEARKAGLIDEDEEEKLLSLAKDIQAAFNTAVMTGDRVIGNGEANTIYMAQIAYDSYLQMAKKDKAPSS